MRRLLAIPALLVVVGCGNAMEAQAQRQDNYRVQQAVSAYETARTKGDSIDLCVKAKLAAIAYADARQPGNARAWQAREAEDCKAALAAAEAR